MISLEHQFLFVHIPKTAGNALQAALAPFSEDNLVCLAPHHDGVERFEIRSEHYDIHKHASLEEYRDQLGQQTLDQLFTFTCVRNPWERLVSYWFSPHRGRTDFDRRQFERWLETVRPMSDYVSLDGPQPCSEAFDSVDAVIRYEQLEQDFARVCERGQRSGSARRRQGVCLGSWRRPSRSTCGVASWPMVSLG